MVSILAHEAVLSFAKIVLLFDTDSVNTSCSKKFKL